MLSAIKPLDTEFREQELVPLEFLVSACGNLVYHDKAQHVLRFVHFSVKEFLMRQPEFEDSEGFVADVCFTILGFSQERDQLKTYAACYWPHHARRWREINDDRSTLIKRFLLAPSRVEEWVKIAKEEKEGFKGWDSAWPPQPPTWTGAIGVCSAFNVPIVLDHLLRRNTEYSERAFPELVSAALFLAAAGGHIDVARLLIDAGANMCWPSNCGVDLRLDWRTGDGMGVEVYSIIRNSPATALQAAAGGGHMAMVALLLSKDADINEPGDLHVPRDQWGRDKVRSDCDLGITAMDTLLTLCRYPAKRHCRQHA